MEIISIGSSSSGNSYILTNGKNNFIVDAGISGKRTKEALNTLKIHEDSIRGIFITHEHNDHIKSINMIVKLLPTAKIFLSSGTYKNSDRFMKIPEERINIIKKDQQIKLGGALINTFELSHDAAEPIGYTFDNGESKAAIVTDTGTITDEILENIKDSNSVVLEANHEISMLKVSSYPYDIKRRILSEYGHLSNDLTGETLNKILEYRIKNNLNKKPMKILLGHLSKDNNTPFNALTTVKYYVKSSGLMEHSNFKIGIACPDKMVKI